MKLIEQLRDKNSWLHNLIMYARLGIISSGLDFTIFTHPGIRAVLFFAVGFTGLILSELVLLWLTSLALPLLWTKFLSLVMVGFVQFCLNRLLSFGIHFDS